MVITIDSGTEALIYDLALIPAIFGLDWVSKNGPMSNSGFNHNPYPKPSVPNLGINYPNWAIGPFDFGNGLFFSVRPGSQN